MASADGGAPAPIIVRRIVRKGEGHHGGAWKVAYADFVTAMMAFFLVMWLVGASTDKQKAAISEYFNNPSAVQGTSLTPSPGAIGQGGSGTNVVPTGAMDAPTGPTMMAAPQVGKADTEAETERRERERDRQRLEALREELNQAIAQSQALAPFKDQLLLDITPEGLRIQIIDQYQRPMFDLGSSQLKDYTVEILAELAGFITGVPNRVSLAGHTDVTPYSGSAQGYTNWELSADRANAARRALVGAGMADDKIARVVGLASSVPFDRADPASPSNRRISIIVLNRETEHELQAESAPPGAVAEVPSNVDEAGVVIAHVPSPRATGAGR